MPSEGHSATLGSSCQDSSGYHRANPATLSRLEHEMSEHCRVKERLKKKHQEMQREGLEVLGMRKAK